MYIPRRLQDMLVTINSCLQGRAPAHINRPINVRTRIFRVKEYGGTPLFGHQLNTGTLNTRENLVCLDNNLIYFLGQRTFSCTRAPNHKFQPIRQPRCTITVYLRTVYD